MNNLVFKNCSMPLLSIVLLGLTLERLHFISRGQFELRTWGWGWGCCTGRHPTDILVVCIKINIVVCWEGAEDKRKEI